jgi:hypothetical protein
VPSLAVYLVVEQDRAEVAVLRRREHGFQRAVVTGRDAVVALPEIGCELPLAEIYEGITFDPA